MASGKESLQSDANQVAGDNLTPRVVNGGNHSPEMVQKDWGIQENIAVTGCVALKKLKVLPHQAISLQVHPTKGEVYYVLEGKGSVFLGRYGEVVHRLKAGDPLEVPAGAWHRIVAEEEPFVIIEASTPQTTQIIRGDDRYGRTVNPDFNPDHYQLVLTGKL